MPFRRGTVCAAPRCECAKFQEWFGLSARPFGMPFWNCLLFVVCERLSPVSIAAVCPADPRLQSIKLTATRWAATQICSISNTFYPVWNAFLCTINGCGERCFASRYIPRGMVCGHAIWRQPEKSHSSCTALQTIFRLWKYEFVVRCAIFAYFPGHFFLVGFLFFLVLFLLSKWMCCLNGLGNNTLW